MKDARTVLLTVLVVLLSIIPSSSQAQRTGSFEVLEVGSFHGSDVPLPRPPSWDGVFCQEETCRLKRVTVRTSLFFDEVVDLKPNAPSGTSIDVTTKRKPIFLVRGIAKSERKLRTWWVGERHLLAGESHYFRCDSSVYELRVDGKRTPEENVSKGNRLIYSNGFIEQKLFTVPEHANDAHVTLLWTGDLDGDDKPDLYIDVSEHYNVSNRELWLSSLAQKGELLRKAASFRTTGC